MNQEKEALARVIQPAKKLLRLTDKVEGKGEEKSNCIYYGVAHPEL